MSLAASLNPNLKRKITTINYQFPEGSGNNSFGIPIFIPTKPCHIISFKTKLFLRTNMELNFDNTDPDNPSYFFGGNSCLFVIYRKHYPTESVILPSVINGTDMWTRNEEDLIDYGWMKVDTPAPVTPMEQTVSATGTVVSTGVIVGPILAPTGTGDVGPLDVDLNSEIEFSFNVKTPLCGGTTVDHYNAGGCLNLQLQGTGDSIQIVGIHSAIDDVNTGVLISGTVEVMIQY